MEPLAALSLAANVGQIVDFSLRIVSKSSELYRSSNGRLVQHTDLATTSADLCQLTTQLSESITPHHECPVLSEDETALLTLCKGCIEVSNEVQLGLAKLQIVGQPSRRRSLRKALKSIWSKEHIAYLQSRLVEYRSQLDSRILIGLRAQLKNIELQQSAAFEGLDDGIKTLLRKIVDVSSGLQVQIDQRADDADTSLHRGQDAVIDAIAESSKAHEQRLQAVHCEFKAVQASADRNFVATEESRNEIVASVDRSSAANMADREQMQQRLAVIEEQITAHTEELEQINVKLGQLLSQLASSSSNVESTTQRNLIQETNLLCKVMVAKDIMLQKLIELAETIKGYLFGVRSTITSMPWRLLPYEKPASEYGCNSNHKLMFGPKVASYTRFLFESIGNGDVDGVKIAVDIEPNTNHTATVKLYLQYLDADAQTFYSAICPVMPTTQQHVGPVTQPESPSLTVEISPLTWTLFAIPADDADTRLAVLEVLINRGASRVLKDASGLSAYDHARILKLDQNTIDKLYPFTHNRFSHPNYLIDMIRTGDLDQALHCLELKAPTLNLDTESLSPIALALQIPRTISLIPVLLNYGFSPFAVNTYGTDSTRLHSMAYVTTLPDADVICVLFRDWVSEHHGQGVSDMEILPCIGLGLDLIRRTSGNSYFKAGTLLDDALLLSIMLDKEACVRHCLQRTGPFSWADLCRWPMYAAIRAGHIHYVEMLLERIDERWMARHDLLPWIKEGFLLLHWPLPCACSHEVHSIESRYLDDYLQALLEAPLCSSCELLRAQYSKVEEKFSSLPAQQRRKVLREASDGDLIPRREVKVPRNV